jgi:ribosomal protein L39E
MPKVKPLALKLKLAKQAKRTRWAPIFAIIKRFGFGKRVHPSEITRIRRNWRRRKIHPKLKRIEIKKIKSGRKKKKY